MQSSPSGVRADGGLEPMDPREAMELWLDRQESEKAAETVQSYRYRLKQFVEWCEENDLENLNTLDGRDLMRYDSARRSRDLSKTTLNNQLGTLRQFLAWCEKAEAVPEDTAAKLEVPKMRKGERANEELLSPDRAKWVREQLARYKRASRDHALFVVAWHTGARLGGLRALDVEDCYLEADDLERLRHQDDVDDDALAKVSPPFLYFRHRPAQETPLKNKRDGERPVALSDSVAEVVAEYLRVGRANTRDAHERRPLFSTEKRNGRISKGGIRSRMNIITQPTRYGAECPHGRDVESCEAREHGYESRCPSARSPHRLRTGSITHHLDCGWPIEALAERVNATPQVIREHYDQPELLTRMESRREHLANLEA